MVGEGRDTSGARNESLNWILACIRLCVCLFVQGFDFRQSFVIQEAFDLMPEQI